MRGEGSRLSVLLVDDHAVVREGYRRLLERRGDIVVVGEAADAPAAYSLFCSLRPQIVVMDITLPGVSGIGVTRRMLAHQPRARVLIFSMHEDTIFASRALLAGAAGYVTKASAPSVLVEAVHAVASGRRYLSPDIAQRLALRTFEVTQVRGLSEREFEVLRLLARGRTVREIAESMGLNAKTIANHQSAIKQKLGADTALQLLRKASQLGLDSDSDASAAPVADRMWEDR
ncbi:MAG TPA: response regulator transcription factor [Steroidobacteraceae bacterium]|jgi:two-component system, NarL family, invasion response regulator UvrY|nr:response regulator transcription factor [Steroidobacteraceae bacterium]